MMILFSLLRVYRPSETIHPYTASDAVMIRFVYWAGRCGYAFVNSVSNLLLFLCYIFIF